MFFFRKKKKYKKKRNQNIIKNSNKPVVIPEVNENELSNKSLSFFGWIQEFSKKIVSITFVIFVVINLFVLAAITISYFNSGDLLYLETLLTEIHQTFRDVIGGYIIKSATENAIKIGGGVLEKYLEYRLKFKYNITGAIDFDKHAPENESIEDPECSSEFPEDELSS